MNIIDFVKKVFIGGEWVVGYKRKNHNSYEIIKLDEGWIADPFLFSHKGDHYIFAEYVKKTKGEIACFKIINNTPVFQSIVLSEPYHLSYPCVFECENNIYMIPESADNRSVDLYMANEFPYKWEKVDQLLQGVFYDTTYFKYNGKDYLISYSPQVGRYTLDVFELDIKKYKTELVTEIQYKENIGRPAGCLYQEDGVIYRPAQDCSRMYGEKLLFYKADLKDRKYEEELVRTLSVEEVKLPYQRIHTYNFDSDYEVIDCFKEKLQPFRSFEIIAKLVKQRFGV